MLENSIVELESLTFAQPAGVQISCFGHFRLAKMAKTGTEPAKTACIKRQPLKITFELENPIVELENLIFEQLTA